MKPMRMASVCPKRFRFCRCLLCLLLCNALKASVFDFRITFASSGQTPTESLHVPELEAGFQLLYQLKLSEARNHFEVRQQAHPDDPLGSASEAASYLFEECYRQGILTSAFFPDDKRFLGKAPIKPDPELRTAFFAEDNRAKERIAYRLQVSITVT